MINPKGIIQNNATASDFIRQQRKFNEVYKILTKEEERAIIEGYARLKLGPDGKPIYRTEPSAEGLNDDFECEFEWIGDETELRLRLAMHNLQAVTKITTKHCQDTRDYDDMYAKGLFGLTRAANLFHPFKLITKTVGFRTDEKTGKKVPIREPKLDDSGNYQFIKFITYAQTWIFKYVMDEFYQKSVPIDNNSISLSELARFCGREADSKGATMENYIQSMLHPDVEPPKTVDQEVAEKEAADLYESIHSYIETSSDISALERDILEESFYGAATKDPSVKRLSSILKVPQADIMSSQLSAFTKLKDYLYEEFGIESLSDVM